MVGVKLLLHEVFSRQEELYTRKNDSQQMKTLFSEYYKISSL